MTDIESAMEQQPNMKQSEKTCTSFRDGVCLVGDPATCPLYDDEHARCKLPEVDRTVSNGFVPRPQSFIRKLETSALPILMMASSAFLGYVLGIERFVGISDHMRIMQTQRYETVHELYLATNVEKDKRIGDIVERMKAMQLVIDSLNRQLTQSEELRHVYQEKHVPINTPQK